MPNAAPCSRSFRWPLNASSKFPRVVVFTDLDASLLDHADYSFQDALPALDLIRARNVPLVFTTSKTRAEVERLQAVMRIREPFIVENGAALFFPDNYRQLRIDSGFRQPPYTVIQLGASYAEIRRFVYACRDQFRIRGFGDMGLAQVAELTGLAPDQARLAKRREFTEPFLPEKGTDIAAFEKIAAARGFSITRGGRFYHLIGIRQDKGAAVRLAAGVFSKNAEAPVTTIGIGDPGEVLVKALAFSVFLLLIAANASAGPLDELALDRWAKLREVERYQLQIAERYYKQQNWKAALAECEKFVTLYERSEGAPYAQLKWALCQVQLRQANTAIKDGFQSVIDYWPDSPDAILARYQIARHQRFDQRLDVGGISRVRSRQCLAGGKAFWGLDGCGGVGHGVSSSSGGRLSVRYTGRSFGGFRGVLHQGNADSLFLKFRNNPDKFAWVSGNTIWTRNSQDIELVVMGISEHHVQFRPDFLYIELINVYVGCDEFIMPLAAAKHGGTYGINRSLQCPATRIEGDLVFSPDVFEWDKCTLGGRRYVSQA